LEPDEGLFRGETRLKLFDGLAQYRGEGPGRFREVRKLGRIGEGGGDAQADGQLAAGPIVDRPAAGDLRQSAQILFGGPLRQAIPLADLIPKTLTPMLLRPAEG